MRLEQVHIKARETRGRGSGTERATTEVGGSLRRCGVLLAGEAGPSKTRTNNGALVFSVPGHRLTVAIREEEPSATDPPSQVLQLGRRFTSEFRGSYTS